MRPGGFRGFRAFEQLALKGFESVRRRLKAKAMSVTNDDAGFYCNAEGLRADFNNVVIGHEKKLCHRYQPASCLRYGRRKDGALSVSQRPTRAGRCRCPAAGEVVLEGDQIWRMKRHRTPRIAQEPTKALRAL